mgnify:CR=1 FL=1|tara:strand:+ start:316 stop:486 length:171 start_codon:yes stop_codon:yes gene_type:complete
MTEIADPESRFISAMIQVDNIKALLNAKVLHQTVITSTGEPNYKRITIEYKPYDST